MPELGAAGRVFTIPSGSAFLATLARTVLAGHFAGTGDAGGRARIASLGEPATAQEIMEDEARFMDRSRIRLFTVEECESAQRA